jgi:hypothetical protein
MEPRTPRTAEGGVIRLDPAASLVVRVVDETGSAIPEFHAIVREPTRGGNHAFAAKDGGFVVQWRRTTDLPSSVDASVVVWASGRRIERRWATIPPAASRDSITVDLGPLLPAALLRIRPTLGTHPTADRTVVIGLSLPERPDDEIARVGAVWSGESFSWSATLPPGRFRLRAVDQPGGQTPLLDETELEPRGTIERTWSPSDSRDR